MRQRKLQVFLSSTYEDLIDHRLAAMEAILAAGHIPAAMEQFTAGDETAWESKGSNLLLATSSNAPALRQSGLNCQQKI